MRKIQWTRCVAAALALSAACERDETGFSGPAVGPGSTGGFATDSGMPFVVAPPPERLPVAPVTAGEPPPPISGGTLAISPDGAFAVAADSDRDRVDVVQLPEGELLGSVELFAGSEPGRVAFDAHGQAHVALRGGGVARIEVATATLLGTAKACRHPRGLAVDATDDSLWVACLGGDLLRLSASDHSERSRQFVQTDLRDVIVNEQGTFVSLYRSAELLRVDAAGQVLERQRARKVRVGPDLEMLGFATSDGGVPLELDDGSLEGLLGDLDLEPTTAEPTLAWRTVGVGDQLVMLHQRARMEAVSVEPGGYGAGGAFGCGGVAASAISIKRAGQPLGVPVSIADVTLAVDAAVSPDGRYVAVAAPGQWLQTMPTTLLFATSEITAEPEPPEEGDEELPATPCQFARSALDSDGQTVAVAFGPDGRLYTLSREPHRLNVYEVVSAGDELSSHDFWNQVLLLELGGESVRDTAHDLFHSNVGGGMSCATCHGELTDDAHVWEFEGIGPRRTQTMRGGLLGTEPFHWDGDMADFSMLVHEVMTGRMGGFDVPPDMQDALATWIDQQPAIKVPARNASAVERGRELFESDAIGCAECHSGEKRTNNLSFDVGTGGTFQVPSLLGLGGRAPYMHDGCAPDLMARFEPSCGGGDQHGRTSHLTQAEKEDLVAYLRSL